MVNHMKKRFKYISILIMGVFIFNGSDVSAINGVITNSCVNSHTCMAVCGYQHVSNPVKEYTGTRNTTGNVTNDITIYYHFSSKKWQILSGRKTDSGQAPENFDTGIKEFSDVFKTNQVHVQGISISKDDFSCPKNAYIDLSKSLFNGAFELCFDNDGKACANSSNSGTSFGTNSYQFVSTKKTYSVFSQIKTYGQSTKAIDVDCSIYSDKSKGYLNNDGSLNKEKVYNYFEEKIERDFLAKFLGGEDENGNGRVDNRIPKFVKNHKEYKALFDESANSSVLSKIKSKCNAEIQQLCDNGSLNSSECQNAKNNVNNQTAQDITTSQEDLERADNERFSMKKIKIQEVDETCEGMLSKEGTEFLQKVLKFIQYGGVIVALLSSTLDFIKSVSSGSQDDLKKASTRFLKRMVFAALLFFVVILTNILLGIFNITVPSDCL